MQFEALKVFCDVARLRSFSQAGAANGLTQSAVSQIVLHLEKRLGVQLIDRSTRPFQLTPQGQRYFEGCNGLVEQYLELEAVVRRSEAELATSVQVVAIYSVGLRDMNQYLQQSVALQPNVEVRIEYLHPDLVYQRVLDGTADLGLVSYPKKSRALEALPWREEEMVLACAPDHPLARQRSVRLAQLDGARWVGFDANLVIHKKLDALLRKHNIRVDVQMRFDNIESIKRAVEVSSGVALLPLPTIEREIEVGTLMGIPLAGVRLFRPLAIIHRSHRRLNSAIQCFIDVLRQPDEPPRANGRRGVPGARAAAQRGEAGSK
jgi:DNA-binding transcriptional LysR family regulator